MADFIAAAGMDGNGDGETISSQHAGILAGLFYHPEVGQMLGAMLQQNPNATVGDIASYFGSAQSLAGFMQNFTPATRAAIFTGMG